MRAPHPRAGESSYGGASDGHRCRRTQCRSADRAPPDDCVLRSRCKPARRSTTPEPPRIPESTSTALRALPWHHARNIADTVADVLTPRAEDRERLNGTLNQLRDMLTSIIPQEFHGVLHGVSVAPLRRELFAMMHGADSR